MVPHAMLSARGAQNFLLFNCLAVLRFSSEVVRLPQPLDFMYHLIIISQQHKMTDILLKDCKI